MKKNEEEDESINIRIESTESKDRKISESEERVSSHGRPVRENSGSGVERLEMSFDDQSYSHNTNQQIMMIKETYNVN